MKQNRPSNSSAKTNSKTQSGKQVNVVDENLKKLDSSEALDTGADLAAEADKTSESNLDKFTNQLLKLAPGIADSSITQAKEALQQAISTFDQAKETYVQAKETVVQVKATIEEVKSSAKGAIGKIRSNPQPFFAAIAPGAIGAYLLVEKWRKSQTS